MENTVGIDSITLCGKDLHAAEYPFNNILGFHTMCSATDLGSEQSKRDTIVVQRHNVKIALMQGHDKIGKSHRTEFIERFGPRIQHIALEVEDREAVCQEWEAHGVKFSGPMKEGRDGFGPLRQRFTYPLFPGSGIFLELTQRRHGHEESKPFVEGTVESLYQDTERDQTQGVEQTIIDFDRVPKT